MLIHADAESAINYVLKFEGGYADDPNDTGSVTNFGISLRFLQNLSPEQLRQYAIFEVPTLDTIQKLTLEQAKLIYRGEFWTHAPFDKLYSQEVANYLFDMAVNMGINPAVKCAQRATWAVMKDWQGLIDDGVLGDKTIATMRMCGHLLLPPLRAERANYYREIVTKYPKNAKFLTGWLNRTYAK